MFIKDIDRVVGGYLRKKCNQKLFNRTSNNFSRDQKKHNESCKGPDQQKNPKLDQLALQFMPYLKSNKTIQKLFAAGQTKQFPKDQEQGVSYILQPTKNYKCIEAETVEEQNQDYEQIYTQLKPLSIVIGTQINNKIQSKYIDIRTQDFMNKFIEQMWKLANEVNEANLAFEPIVKLNNEYEQQKHQQKIHQVAIFGFNSKNNDYLGQTTQQKQVTIRHVDYQFELVFKDVLTFIPPTTFDNFGHQYGNGTKLTKGKFPHRFFNTTNVNQFLSSTESFEHNDFYNSINRKNNSDKYYQEYVEDFVSLDINDLDFNLLQPSAFCGIYNKNNPYTGGKMYMAVRVTKHIKIREANDQDYRDTKRKDMMNIINSEDRFSEEKGQLFIASVQGHIDKNHINEHINFPPIRRKHTYKTDEKTVAKKVVQGVSRIHRIQERQCVKVLIYYCKKVSKNIDSLPQVYFQEFDLNI
ncbi:MAG: hypothetical protein EZS28_021620 [Streblomastix strix]|uniref:Uncharacterized protein n=1 Tax=Streblomastix strix TaxID=222440 RepID=A0A5J4VK64_9EUKA|nr:MAG: hypothetical protein EZS28_021620 [Streblomastix strix]